MKPGERPYAEDRPLNRNKKEAAGKAEKPEPTAPSSEGREARPSRRAGHDYNVNETGRQEAA